MKEIKTDRVLEIFFRAMKGEELSARELANEYGLSVRSISRDITAVKNFLADHRDTVGHAELVYSGSNHCYHLEMDHFLSNKELLAITKALIGARPFSQQELLTLLGKLKLHTTYADRQLLSDLIRKELYHYSEIKFDCDSVIDNIWDLAGYIEKQQTITITYHRMDRRQVMHKLKPLSLMFSEYYFYLIAYKAEDETNTPIYFRVDRITDIVAHREHFELSRAQEFDEGMLRKRSQFMWPGKLMTIRFEFTGPSVQAVLDKLPTAKVIDRDGGKYLIEAEVYGDGIKMFLLSQGAWVKVIAPDAFVEEIRADIARMNELYQQPSN